MSVPWLFGVKQPGASLSGPFLKPDRRYCAGMMPTNGGVVVLPGRIVQPRSFTRQSRAGLGDLQSASGTVLAGGNKRLPWTAGFQKPPWWIELSPDSTPTDSTFLVKTLTAILQWGKAQSREILIYQRCDVRTREKGKSCAPAIFGRLRKRHPARFTKGPKGPKGRKGHPTT